MKLSNNFSLGELTKSATAIRFGINNNPATEQVAALSVLCNRILQPCRDHFGKSIMPSSGFRSIELSEKLGSSSKSQHTKGEAVDFEIAGIDNMVLAEWLAAFLDFDQLILEYYIHNDPASGWIHCSYSRFFNRNEVLRTVTEGGKLKYLPGLV